ncbi:POTRA domain-containing protein [Winogradskyella endarachnes]|uniref:POTRA domain-containing protein n=1 Tax=Winogradskyella endarachnes TaxID=2681965 RepID=UPI001E3AC482|nr:POTRA domain-containing protein [Winogradskyella endarachnes]
MKITGETIEKTTIIDSISYKKQFSNYQNLKAEVSILKQLLTKQGYIDTSIEKIAKINDSLFEAKLYLGNKIKKLRLFINSELKQNHPNLLTNYNDKNYIDIEIKDLNTYLNNLNLKMTENGDPFSSLQLINHTKLTTDIISAELIINSNKKRRIDHIIIKGYEKFPKSYLTYFLKLKSGKTFNLNTIKKKTELLNNLQFANKIKDPEVLFTEDSTSLYIYVEKSKTNIFDGFLGFGTNEDTNKIEFDGYLDLRLINNLNYGETLNLYYKSDEIDQQTLKIDTELPYIFSLPIGIQIGLNLFRKDSTFLNASQYAKINYLINPRNKVSIGISSTKSTNLLESDSDILNDYTANYYTIQYNHLKTEPTDLLFPINFWFNFLSGYGNRDNNLGSQKQSIFTLDTYKIFNLNRKNSIYTRLNSAKLTSDNYLDNELFRFGGINSIRGFEENSIVAHLYSVLNTEYRYRLSNSLYVHSVFDAAYFENKLNDSKEKLFGFGFGIGLITNAGLFRLNYSSGKTENTSFKLSDSKVHLSLTASF